MELHPLSHWTSHDLGQPAQYGLKAKPDELVVMVAVATVPRPKLTKYAPRTLAQDLATWEEIAKNLDAYREYAAKNIDLCRAELEDELEDEAARS